MPRALTLGNGRLLVTFDPLLNMRDLYYPHVGLFNHLNGRFNGMGVWINGQFRWIDESWKISLEYQYETLVTKIAAEQADLQVRLNINSCVHKNLPLFLEQIEIENLTASALDMRLLFYHDFCLNETEIGDTAFFSPNAGALVHYKRDTYLLINGRTECEGQIEGIFQYTTCRQRDDQSSSRQVVTGSLDGSQIAQGRVDSAISLRTRIEPHQDSVYCSYWIAAGKTFDEVKDLNSHIIENGVQKLFEETSTYWYSWVSRNQIGKNLPNVLADLYRRSLLVIRTQIDHQGAILAANDTDSLQFNRDHYSYLWPRDGALTALALDRAGYQEVTKRFFRFCEALRTKDGYFLHKYGPDGSAGSSWHPWLVGSEVQLPIQEDETGLILYALWHHYECYGDLEFADSNYRSLIKPCADFLVSFRDPETGLPRPSYDLWEERHGIHAFTVAAVQAGLKAAAKFAVLLGDPQAAETYNGAADEVAAAFQAHFFDEQLDRFSTSLYLTERSRPDRMRRDVRLDSSVFAIFYLGMLPAEDSRAVATMRAVEQDLWIRKGIGGLARCENDYYYQVERQDIAAVPGNPWVISTLWLAQWQIATAKCREDLAAPLSLLRWTAERATSAGLLAEQYDPYSGTPLSVSPLTWSHATLCLTVQEFDAKYRKLEAQELLPAEAASEREMVRES